MSTTRIATGMKPRAWDATSVAHACKLLATNEESIQFYNMACYNKSRKKLQLQLVFLETIPAIPVEIQKDIVENPTHATISVLLTRFEELERNVQRTILESHKTVITRNVAQSAFLATQNEDIIEQYQYSPDVQIRYLFAGNIHIDREKRLQALKGYTKNGDIVRQFDKKPRTGVTAIPQTLFPFKTAKERLALCDTMLLPVLEKNLDMLQHLDKNAARDEKLATLGAIAISCGKILEHGLTQTAKSHFNIAVAVGNVLAHLTDEIFRLYGDPFKVQLVNEQALLENLLTAIWSSRNWKFEINEQRQVRPRYHIGGIADELYRTLGLGTSDAGGLWPIKAERLQEAGHRFDNIAAKIGALELNSDWILKAYPSELSYFIQCRTTFDNEQQKAFCARIETFGLKKLKENEKWIESLLEKADTELVLAILQAGARKRRVLFHENIIEKIDASDAAKTLPMDLVILWPKKQIEDWLDANHVNAVDLLQLSKTVDATAQELAVLAGK